MKYKGTCAFDGTDYVGWQTQQNGRSIEEKIVEIFSQIYNQPIKIYGASRTDAGVHAEGYVFHYEVESMLIPNNVVSGFNRLAPLSIRLLALEAVDDMFSARFSISKKTYRYQLYQGESSPFEHRYYHYIYRKLSIERMQQVLDVFKGQHDFRNFTIKEEDTFDFQRTIYSLELKVIDEAIHITFVGNGFMTHMIRMLVGTVLAFEKGKITMEFIEDKLTSKERKPVPFKVEPKGLILERINYE
jgi:tRNA pseudouridine38-40 synthase